MSKCKTKLKKRILRDIDLDLPEYPNGMSREALRREMYGLPYVPLRDAEDYAEFVADERGLSYA